MATALADPPSPRLAVSFDFGQTLAELDTAFLSRRLAERGVEIGADALEAAVPGAWRAYDDIVRSGRAGHPWKPLMQALLAGAAAPAARIPEVVDWLWDQQPIKNLWRRPIPDMIGLARELDEAGVPIAVVSNSEGKLAELIEELDLAGLLRVVADSGKLGLEKPDRRIFDWAADQLGVATTSLVHVGDSFGADVRGACDAGARAIYFPRAHLLEPIERARAALDAAAVRVILVEWGVPLDPSLTPAT